MSNPISDQHVDLPRPDGIETRVMKMFETGLSIHVLKGRDCRVSIINLPLAPHERKLLDVGAFHPDCRAWWR
jgi:hypothetical protein